MRRWLFVPALVIGLVPTPAVVSGAHASYDPDAAAVPIRFRGHRMPIVPVSIDGSGPYWFLLDTGSNRTAVSATLARRLGVERLGTTNVVAVTDAIALEVVSLKNVTVGTLTRPDLPALALPDEQLRSLDIDGVLGQDVLMTQSHTIDYRRGRLVWHAGLESTASPTTKSPITLRHVSGMWLAELPQDERGHDIVRLVPDTGAQALVLFEANLPPSLQLSPLADVATSTFSGRAMTRAARVRRLRVGPVVHVDEPAVIVRRQPAAADGHGLLPLSGYDSVTFDVQRRHMIVTGGQRAAAPSAPPDFARAGRDDSVH
jgi:hypothetical protein